MSEKSDDPQNSEAEEFGKAPSLSDVIDEPSSEADDAQSLAEIDQLLAEEDPEFLQQISEIKVEATEGSLSIMEDVLADVKKSRRPSFNWRFHLQNLLFF